MIAVETIKGRPFNQQPEVWAYAITASVRLSSGVELSARYLVAAAVADDPEYIDLVLKAATVVCSGTLATSAERFTGPGWERGIRWTVESLVKNKPEMENCDG